MKGISKVLRKAANIVDSPMAKQVYGYFPYTLSHVQSTYYYACTDVRIKTKKKRYYSYEEWRKDHADKTYDKAYKYIVVGIAGINTLSWMYDESHPAPRWDPYFERYETDTPTANGVAIMGLFGGFTGAVAGLANPILIPALGAYYALKLIGKVMLMNRK